MMTFKPLTKLNAVKEDDPLDELVDILFSFIDEGMIKNMALGRFEKNKPRVRAIIKGNQLKLIILLASV